MKSYKNLDVDSNKNLQTLIGIDSWPVSASQYHIGHGTQ